MSVLLYSQKIINELETDYVKNGNKFDGKWVETSVTESTVYDDVSRALGLSGTAGLLPTAPLPSASSVSLPPPSAPTGPASSAPTGSLPVPLPSAPTGPAQSTNPFDDQSGGGNTLKTIIYQIMMGDYTIHNGKQIVNVPTANELLLRIVAPLWFSTLGVGPANLQAAIVMTSDNSYKQVPAKMSEAFIAALSLTDDQNKALEAWDKRVKVIRDGLANIASAGTTTIQPKNRVLPPVGLNVSSFSRYPATIQNALKVRRMSDPSMDASAMGTLKKLGTISVSMNGGDMRGGNANMHAPLYPSVVMNGGAFPFATPASTTKVNPVQMIQDNITALATQYQSVSGSPINPALLSQINAYATNVGSAVNDLQDHVNAVNGAIPVLAQIPVGRGINPSSWDKTKLEEVAERGKKLNEAAVRASRRFDKLSSIRDLLRELVNKTRPYGDQIPAFTGGSLHEALKH